MGGRTREARGRALHSHARGPAEKHGNTARDGAWWRTPDGTPNGMSFLGDLSYHSILNMDINLVDVSCETNFCDVPKLCELRETVKWGFPARHGGTPIARWFLIWKTLLKFR